MLQDAQKIIDTALKEALPGSAVNAALDKIQFGSGKLLVVAAGKAAWEMARAAEETLHGRIDAGIVITKYDHAMGPLDGFEIREAGHPVPDENSYSATLRALELTSNLTADDSVLFLLSGGGSALFESPLLTADEMTVLTGKLLASGAGITEMNTIRKRVSSVKGGRFAQHCAPAHVFTVVLSDIIGDPLDMIASGPAYPDSTTCQQALEIVNRYHLDLSEKAMQLMQQETPKALDNVTTYVTGSVKQLCATAERVCRELGYEPVILSSSICCEARDAGSFLGSIARDHQDSKTSLAFIAGGETVVHLTGKGKGGRNQEIALAAAPEIDGCRDTCVMSFSSDGTDGPTDADGGLVTGESAARLREKGIDVREVLQQNDAYHALKAIDALIMTGPTGTNVNDLQVVLIKR